MSSISSPQVTENILGYDVRCDGKSSCIEDIVSSIEKKDRGRWAACLNPHSYAVSVDREAFARALNHADWLVPDGVGIVLSSSILGGGIRRRVTGFNLFTGIHNHFQARDGARVYFVGSTEATLTKIADRMARDWPNLNVVGTLSPPFKQNFSAEEIKGMATTINSASPDIVWVGMTAPKQEEWICHAIKDLDASFVGAIGAVFDFYSGNVKRSHPFFRRTGLEWLPRLIREPKRMWKRIFVSTPKFFITVLKQRFGSSKAQQYSNNRMID